MMQANPFQQQMHRIQCFLKRLEAEIYKPIGPLEVEVWKTAEPVDFALRTSGAHQSLVIGQPWGNLFECGWFRFRGTVPPAGRGGHVVLRIDLSGEAYVVDAAGNPLVGLTNVNSVFDRTLGLPGKTIVEVAAAAMGGERIEVWADAGANDLFGNLQDNGRLLQAEMALCDDQAKAAYYDVFVLADLVAQLPESSAQRTRVLRALLAAADAYESGGGDALARVRTLCGSELERRNADPALQIVAIGHAHLDLAWLWPIRETIRKAARTLATALHLMERYPDYRLGVSQPQMLAWVQERYPALYERVREKIRAGRIEPLGGMWIETDCNLVSGESIVRQFLYGQMFWREQFGLQPRQCWLPDTFGYCGTLPQMMRHCGAEWFVTQKLSWNRVNLFPHESMRWKGIDGSEVLAYMLPENTYNGPATPASLATIKRNNTAKGSSRHGLMVFGIGDGGGGPGEEHLKRLARLRRLESLPAVEQASAETFFERWKEAATGFPVYHGELYLERHQGTFTTRAQVKKYNRRAEAALFRCEWVRSAAAQQTGLSYPAEALRRIWREVLLYQFHDVLPGTSINRVYEECYACYEALLGELDELSREGEKALLGRAGGCVAVWNDRPYPRREWVRIEGAWHRVEVPPLGFTLVDAAAPTLNPGGVTDDLSAGPDRLTNGLVELKLDNEGRLSSVMDLKERRELLQPQSRGNELLVYADDGDAWDFGPAACESSEAVGRPVLQSRQPWIDGPRAGIRLRFSHENSVIHQDVVLTQGSRRVDFITRVDWNTPCSTLRVRFPLDVVTTMCRSEIAFGHIARPTHRNTSWDAARQEMPCHGWIDLAERGFGVALLNDCKYGYCARDTALELTLIRNVPVPGAPRINAADADRAGSTAAGAAQMTDEGHHEFTYAILPHDGDVAEVQRAAADFNYPLRSGAAGLGQGKGEKTRGFLHIDHPAVVLSAWKRAEEGEGYILRLVETAGGRAKTCIEFPWPIKEAIGVDGLERHSLEPVVAERCRLRLSFRAFEIKSLQISFVGLKYDLI